MHLRLSSYCAILLSSLSIISISTASFPLTRNATLEIATSEILCTPPPRIYKRDPRPRYPDCITAIQQLPRLLQPATFHLVGADDGFKLPISEAYGSCRVTVRLPPGSERDQSTWVGIRYAALTIADGCEREGRFRVLRTGGWKLVGIATRIVVELTGERVSELGVGGQSAAVAERMGLSRTAVNDA